MGGTVYGGTTVLFITGNSKYNNEVQEEGAKFGDIRIGYSLDEGTVFLWPKTRFIEILVFKSHGVKTFLRFFLSLSLNS